MGFVIRPYEDRDKANWDAFCDTTPNGTFFHRAGWKEVIEKGAGHRCPYLLAENDGKILGILPLTHRQSLLFGKALISNMFGVYGGALAHNEEIRLALEKQAWDYAVGAGLPYFESRNVESLSEEEDLVWSCPTPKSATFIKEIGGKSEEELLLDIPRKQRAVVRKSLKAGLRCDWNGRADQFFSLYAESVRNLGTPVFPKKMFEKILEVFANDIEIQIIRTAEGKPIASLMSFYHGDAVLPYYAGGTPEARLYGAHDFMYFQLMIRAVKRGCRQFDFGRSKIDSGPYKFKKNWGFEPKLLHYRTRTLKGHEVPDLNPANSKYSLMVSVWKKLPLPIANILGPFLARHLG